MKLSKTYKLEAACSKDQTRPGITQPFIQGGRAIATDGRILASVAIETAEGEEVEGKRIPLNALKAARKATLKLFIDSDLTLSETHCTILSGASFPVAHPEVNWLPQVREIVSGLLHKADAAFSVTLDVTLLSRLAEAIGSEKVTLCFKDSTSAISVHPSGTGADAFGLLMPIKQD